MSEVAAVLVWLEGMPDGTLVPPAVIAERLRGAALDGVQPQPEVVKGSSHASTWREKLWTVPADTRLGVREVAEALGKSRDAIYRLTSQKQVPHRKHDGSIVFRAGELRDWIQDSEEQVVKPLPPFRVRVAG